MFDQSRKIFWQPTYVSIRWCAMDFPHSQKKTRLLISQVSATHRVNELGVFGRQRMIFSPAKGCWEILREDRTVDWDVGPTCQLLMKQQLCCILGLSAHTFLGRFFGDWTTHPKTDLQSPKTQWTLYTLCFLLLISTAKESWGKNCVTPKKEQVNFGLKKKFDLRFH